MNHSFSSPIPKSNVLFSKGPRPGLFSFFLFFLLLTQHAGASTGELLLDSANSAYAKKEYPKAVKFFEQVLSMGQEAPDLYYNLGNAYFKSKDIPRAILNYERAKKLKPGDEDTEFNLKTANSLIADKTDNEPVHFLSAVESRLFNLLSERGWSYSGITCFVACVICLLLYFVSVKVRIKQISFSIALLFLLLSVLTGLIARSKYHTSQTHDQAIVLSPQVKAKGSPDEKGTDLFILHEGTKIQLLRNNNGWSEVRLTNGNTGWLPSTAFEVI